MSTALLYPSAALASIFFALSLLFARFFAMLPFILSQAGGKNEEMNKSEEKQLKIW